MTDPTGGCAGKTLYLSRAEARAVLRHRGRPKAARYRATVYRCPQCRGYHIGHQGGRAPAAHVRLRRFAQHRR